MEAITVLGMEVLLRAVNFFRGEELMVERACRIIRARLVPPGLEAFNYQICQGGEMPLARIIESLQGLPLSGSRRLVLIKNPGKIKGEEEEWAKFWALVESPPPGVVLVFAQSGSPDKRLKVFKKLSELSGAAGDFSFKPWERGEIIEPFIEEEFSAQGKKISPAARQQLADFFGEDLGWLAQEIDKIAIFVGAREAVDVPDLAVTSPRIRGDFALAEAISRQDRPEALKIIGELLEQGVYPAVILSQLASAVRGLLQAKIQNRNSWSEAEAGKRLGVASGFLRHYQAGAGKYTAGQLREMLIKLHQTDAAIKTGRQDGAAVLPALVASFCSTS